MKLGKLLFAGNSVVNGCAAVSYRENKQVALPKFVSTKNPFAPAKKETNPAAAVLPSPSPAAVSPRPRSSWTNKLNPASLWGSPPPVEQKTLPAVQTELSLDTVKVVHNDLSDADVEVVPVKSRPAVSEIPAFSPAKRSWEILGERLLKVTAL